MTRYVEPHHESYGAAKRLFEWEIPDNYNIAWDLLQKHEDPKGDVALFQVNPEGNTKTYTYHQLNVRSNQIASTFKEYGISFGDRVAIMVPQKPEYLLTHLACWKLGAVTVPISVLFGEDGLQYRLTDSDAKLIVIDSGVKETLDAISDDCLTLEQIVEVDGESEDSIPFDTLYGGARHLTLAETDADTPATILYTSGTTGDPKGVLHTHDVWIGHTTGFYMWYNCSIEQSVFWTPAEWSWFGSLAGLVGPAMHYGRPIVEYPMQEFDPATAFAVMERFDVTDAFLPPTAIRLMMDVDAPADTYDLSLKAIASGGEPVTSDIYRWAESELGGVAVNEGYGRTEGTMLVCNSQQWFDVKPGSMGKPVIGREVAVLDPETGKQKPTGEFGEIAVKREGDPALFTEYVNEPDKTATGRIGDWDLTGDIAKRDEDGYFWYKSRTDDLIITSGYRVGPAEVEDAILKHDDVQQVGVIGVPNDDRGEIIKAYVQPVEGAREDDHLREEIQNLVKTKLAKHEYPREVEFISELPQTTTGKIQRTELRKWATQ